MRINLRTKLALLLAAVIAVVSLGACSPADVAVGYFPGYARATAHCIIRHESGGNPSAVSRTNDHGLFQINGVHARNFQTVTGKPFYPYVYKEAYNGKYAAWLWRQQGWRPWTTHSRCGV
jgi:hypothetical protein